MHTHYERVHFHVHWNGGNGKCDYEGKNGGKEGGEGTGNLISLGKRVKEGKQEVGQTLGEGGGAEEEGDGDEYHDSEGHESGSTATVCLIKTNTLYVANAGDSRCVLSCNGKTNIIIIIIIIIIIYLLLFIYYYYRGGC